MSKFANLMAEVEFLRSARPEYGILDAIMFISEFEDEYPSEIRRELKEFMRDGRRMFATKEAA